MKSKIRPRYTESISFWVGWALLYPVRLLISIPVIMIISALPSLWSKFEDS